MTSRGFFRYSFFAGSPPTHTPAYNSCIKPVPHDAGFIRPECRSPAPWNTELRQFFFQSPNSHPETGQSSAGGNSSPTPLRIQRPIGNAFLFLLTGTRGRETCFSWDRLFETHGGPRKAHCHRMPDFKRQAPDSKQSKDTSPICFGKKDPQQPNEIPSGLSVPADPFSPQSI